MPLLNRYRNEICSFNDDIQGTAAVTVGTLIAASRGAGSQLSEQNRLSRRGFGRLRYR